MDSEFSIGQRAFQKSWSFLLERNLSWDLPVNTVCAKPSNRDTEISQLRYIHLNSKHVWDFKFGMYIACVAFDKFDVSILKILLFGQLMAEKLPKSGGHIGFFGHKMAKNQNFKNRYTKFVEYHTGKVHNKFQVPAVTCLVFK